MSKEYNSKNSIKFQTKLTIKGRNFAMNLIKLRVKVFTYYKIKTNITQFSDKVGLDKINYGV